MSLASALDAEAKELRRELEEEKKNRGGRRASMQVDDDTSSSARAAHKDTPGRHYAASDPRSMLDFTDFTPDASRDPSPTPAVTSESSKSQNTPNPMGRHYAASDPRSMLDPFSDSSRDPSPGPLPKDPVPKKPSTTLGRHYAASDSRSMLDYIDSSAEQSPAPQPRTTTTTQDTTVKQEPGQESTNTTTTTAGAAQPAQQSDLPLRNASSPQAPKAMSSVYGGQKIRLPGDLGPGDPRRGASKLPGDLGPNDPRKRRTSTAGPKSASPTGRLARPTDSPPAKNQNRNRRLSENVARRKGSGQDGDEGGVRLQKDYAANDDDDDDEAVGSSGSDSESENEYEGDTDASTDSRRGRVRTRGGGIVHVGNAVDVAEDSEDSDVDERGRQQQQKQKGISDPPPSQPLLPTNFPTVETPGSPDPTITITPPTTETNKRNDVHPSTAFDYNHSAASTPVHSDDEEHLSDLRRAQRLSLTVSPIHSTPSAHRVIRQIIRGDYAHFQREAEEGRRRQRVYLVATDLSPEAEYALEWTIGTVLRDGDTLLAVYAVDEEGVGGEKEGVEIGHGADVVKDTASVIHGLPAKEVTRSPAPSPLGKSGREASTARDARDAAIGMTKAERERFKAAEEVSQRCVKLLRKTRLQVRVVVEVFHCKSPKHMITEVIDFLTPTLTILGSRGRSALKGVLLGSFSNYLVTKSSVPVMVARKRLRKHSKKRTHKDGLPLSGSLSGDGRMRYGRMSNVLEAPAGGKGGRNRLVGAKID
ncbi:hypothetical protein M8818_001955 [Zalaria obscura]|uniref:Uncharacterized protein n=1 Tax=Zalaria obscura TaxID=2024903 RepID=A0ACC3SIK4_9PEZI